jgi:hypothetical protein
VLAPSRRVQVRRAVLSVLAVHTVPLQVWRPVWSVLRGTLALQEQIRQLLVAQGSMRMLPLPVVFSVLLAIIALSVQQRILNLAHRERIRHQVPQAALSALLARTHLWKTRRPVYYVQLVSLVNGTQVQHARQEAILLVGLQAALLVLRVLMPQQQSLHIVPVARRVPIVQPELAIQFLVSLVCLPPQARSVVPTVPPVSFVLHLGQPSLCPALPATFQAFRALPYVSNACQEPTHQWKTRLGVRPVPLAQLVQILDKSIQMPA